MADIYPIRVYSYGGMYGIHDYLMSDGSIKTMSALDAASIAVPTPEGREEDEERGIAPDHRFAEEPAPTIIEVLPNFEHKRWEVVINGTVYGEAKQSYDADFHAEMQRSQFGDCIVVHHAEERRDAMDKMKRL